MSDKVFNVLFLCTGNTARSILAEGILRSEGIGRFRAYSAGSQPKGAVNPFAVETLEAFGYAADGLSSKSWSDFAGRDAPQMDFIITVCDNAAGETCPVWPGHPATAHWGIEDPAAVEGSDVEKRKAFNLAFKYLKNRIDLLLATPLSRLDKIATQNRLAEIGKVEGATQMAGTKE
jgi:arsenate reductase